MENQQTPRGFLSVWPCTTSDFSSLQVLWSHYCVSYLEQLHRQCTEQVISFQAFFPDECLSLYLRNQAMSELRLNSCLSWKGILTLHIHFLSPRVCLVFSVLFVSRDSVCYFTALFLSLAVSLTLCRERRILLRVEKVLSSLCVSSLALARHSLHTYRVLVLLILFTLIWPTSPSMTEKYEKI